LASQLTNLNEGLNIHVFSIPLLLAAVGAEF